LMALFKPRISDPRTKMTSTFIANPFDSDWMNGIQAGRFLTYTDAARWEIGIRVGFLKAILKNRWVIISGGQKLIYKRPVKIFRRFQITYQITGWDNRWIYAAHVFHQRGETKAVVFTKLGLRSRGKLVNPHDVFAATGFMDPSPPPAWVLRQFEDDVTTLEESSQNLLIDSQNKNQSIDRVVPRNT
jgi:acyl-CoA thioesterase FadM